MLYNTLPTIELKLINIAFLSCLCAIMFLIGLINKTNNKRLKVLWITLSIVAIIPSVISFNYLNNGIKEYERNQQTSKNLEEIEPKEKDPVIKIDPVITEDQNILSYNLTITYDNIEELKNIKTNINIDNKEYVFDLK